VALITLLSGLAVKHWLPKFPYLIAAMVIGSFAALGFNALFGAEVAAISAVGMLPRSLPPLSVPDFSLDTIKQLATPALAMTLLALTEAVSIGRTLGLRSGLNLLVAPLAAYLPNAAMAGILFLVTWGVIDFKEIRHILKSSRREMAIMMVTFLGALFLELAIFAGVILSLVLYLEKVAYPNICAPCAGSQCVGAQILQ